MEIYLEGIAMRRYNLLRESAYRDWPWVLFEYRLRSPEAEYRQEKIENNFLCADAVAARPQALGADTAACVRRKSMWPEAYWIAGFHHWFPEGSEVETTSIARGATLRGPAKARTSFPKPFSPEGRSSNRPSARWASGESVASVAKTPKEGL